jgi:hypothetical protein
MAAADAGALAIVLLASVVGLPLGFLFVAMAILASIVIVYAERAIAIEDVGARAGLAAGWRLLQANRGVSVIVWLLAVGLQILAGVAIAAVVAIAFVPLLLIGVAFWAADGFGVGTIAYAVLAGLALLLILMVVSGAAGSYMWSYWTLAYLRLTGRSDTASPTIAAES